MAQDEGVRNRGVDFKLLCHATESDLLKHFYFKKYLYIIQTLQVDSRRTKDVRKHYDYGTLSTDVREEQHGAELHVPF